MSFDEHVSAEAGQSLSWASRATPIVFVVDDDVSVCESLELLIRGAGWQPEISTSAAEFLTRPRQLTPSCLVLDVKLPDLNELDLQKLIVDRAELPIIFIRGQGSVSMTPQTTKAGVELLTKPFDEQALLNAMRCAFERSQYVLKREAQLRYLRERYTSLSHRERQVLALVVSGRLNKQVAGVLGISEITVKGHRGRMMRKMNARSFASLIAMAMSLRLVSAALEEPAARPDRPHRPYEEDRRHLPLIEAQPLLQSFP